VTPQEQDELDAYFWQRTRKIVVVIVLFTLGGLMIGPYQERRFHSVKYRSDKTAAAVTGKKEYAAWYSVYDTYQVTYDYSVEDETFTTTEEIEYKECFDRMVVGQQIYIYYDRNQPEKSYNECDINLPLENPFSKKF